MIIVLCFTHLSACLCFAHFTNMLLSYSIVIFVLFVNLLEQKALRKIGAKPIGSPSKNKNTYLLNNKTQISLGIYPVWPVFAVRLKTVWATHKAHSEAWCPVWFESFAECTGHFVCFVVLRLIFGEEMNRLKTKWPLRPAKTQLSLGIRPAWSVFAIRRKKHWVLSYP